MEKFSSLYALFAKDEWFNSKRWRVCQDAGFSTCLKYNDKI